MKSVDINIADVIAGDSAAWKQVYDCFWTKMVFYCLKIGGWQRLKEDAEEIVSDVFLKAYKYRHKLQSTSHLNNMLYQGVRRTSVGFEKNEASQRNRIIDASATEEIFFDPLAEEMDLDKVLCEVLEYIESLKPKYREAIKTRLKDKYCEVRHDGQYYLYLCRLRQKLIDRFPEIKFLRHQFYTNGLKKRIKKIEE